VLDGRPLPKRGQSPPFLAHVCCGQMAAWVKMPLGTEVGLGPDDIGLDGDPARPSQKGGRAPSQFSAHVCCGQTPGWIKMALGMKVGLGPRYIVLDGDPVTPNKRSHPPHLIFGPCLLWQNGWMDEDATWCRSRPRSRPHIRWGLSSHKRG